jgi:DNA-binding HxlR family transcriptional regulator
VTGRRSYGDPCGVARGLDLVGDRWALLIVRELLFGPRRFTDLRAGLPGASPNVLSQRLDELEAAGVVLRRRLAPPAASSVYDLTGWGRELEGVLIALGRWGSQAPLMPAAELSARALMLALKTTFDAAAAGRWRARIELRLGEDRFSARVGDGRLELAAGAERADDASDAEAAGPAGPAGDSGPGRRAADGPGRRAADGPGRRAGDGQPDAVIEAGAPALRGLVFGGRVVGEAERSGDLRIAGDRQAALRFLGLFPRPRPVTAPPAGGSA